MTDEELLEWYKKNASKPADMTQQEYELNTNKALKLQTDQQLQANLNNQQSALAKQQAVAQQSASISNDKLMKYLGQSQLAGNTATGQRGSDYINANNNYVKARASIANNYAQQQNDLLESYNTSKLQNQASAYDNEIAIMDKYRQQAIQEEQLARDKEAHALDKQVGEAELEAYKQQIAQSKESFETAKEDKLKAEQVATDDTWYQKAQARLANMIAQLQDDKGHLGDAARKTIEDEIQSYASKFNDPKYIEMLMDVYRTDTYGM